MPYLLLILGGGITAVPETFSQLQGDGFDAGQHPRPVRLPWILSQKYMGSTELSKRAHRM
jgi:hypothetical protein